MVGESQQAKAGLLDLDVLSDLASKVTLPVNVMTGAYGALAGADDFGAINGAFPAR